ncbi:MAG: lysylphosphatidylglycerol synthase transmembrane domain-containing protein [Acidobacteria bacterium]|nr:lysylphosphatidylglycerol synthase transmembrane domain-containing protein [Acidobacteriota bacterium]
MRRGAIGLVLRVSVTLGLLALLLFVVAKPEEVMQSVRRTAPMSVLAAVALCAFDRVIMAFKWWLLLRARRLPISFGIALRAYFASSLYGLILPVTVGADAVRVLALRHAGVPDVTASVVVERSLGVIATGSVAVLSGLVLAGTVSDRADPTLSSLLLAGVVVSAALFVASFAAAARAARWAQAPAAVRRAAVAYSLYGGHPGVLGLFYGLSVFESLLFAGTVWILAAGMAVPFSLPAAVATVPMSLAVARLPVSLGGFGVQEVAFVFFAGLVGVPANEAFSVFLLAGGAMLAALLPSAFDARMLLLRRQVARDGGIVGGRDAGARRG